MADNPNAYAPLAADRIAQLEERVARLEGRLARLADGSPAATATGPPREMVSSAAPMTRAEDELEFEVGQNWFALVGVVVLTIGAGFTLWLPYASLPAVVPSLIGFALAAGLFVLARIGRQSFELISSYLRGVSMALLFFSTLRLSFPLSRHVLDVDSWPAHALLVATIALNLWFALRQRSPWLTGVALLTGGLTVVVVSAHWLAFGLLVSLAIVAVVVSERASWRAFGLCTMVGGYATYLAWAFGPLFRGAPLHFATSPALAPAILLDCTLVFASGAWWRPKAETESAWENIHALVNCALGYGLFFVHTIVAFPSGIALAHGLAFAVFLALAIVYWVRRQSRGATFFYAMTGYAALSVAILKMTAPPSVFVWLSVQSLVVVATAIWFRSRFIVVANFVIFVGIVLVYMLVVEHETGISLGFGIVALLSARILNWQKDRLALKTELMRNAYLLSGFIVFPYALYHLVPIRQVGLAWVGLALAYYVLNFIVQSQKYRWMGHATLLLATCYIVIVGTSRLEPVYRVLSFLVLGTVLLIVSLVFTRLRKHRHGEARTVAPPV